MTCALAGDLAADRAGTTWAQLVHDRILGPLGMRETTTGTPDESSHRNMASAHDYVNDTIRPIKRYATDNIAPAGAMYSSVSDMAIWLRFLLDSPRPRGKPLPPAQGYRGLLTPRILVA